MNGRSGLVTFFLFLFLAMVILLQVLSMVQADRLVNHLNHLIETLPSGGLVRLRLGASPRRVQTAKEKERSEGTDLSGEEYPGDEGDWLIWHIYGEPRTLNPISVESSIEARTIAMNNIFEPLFYYDLDFDGVKLKPVLAESYRISDDGLEITVKLKENIWFSDGAAVTADDVIFTYETTMNPGVDAADLRNYYNNFDRVIRVDERTIKFVLKDVYWKTLETVGIFEVLPKHIYNFTDPNEFNRHRSNPVGSGPYVFEKWDVGQRIVLRRNENYWGRKPKLDKMVFKFITNITAALQALRSHEIDYMEPSSEQFDMLLKDERFKAEFHIQSYWQASAGFVYIGWNQKSPLFGDHRVRLAMTYAVDRQAMVEKLGMGYGKVITGPFYVFGRQNDPNIEPWPFDLDKARQLLSEAGWVDTDGDGLCDKDGRPLRFAMSYPSENTSAERMVKLMKDDFSKIGVDLTADPVEWSIFLARLNDRNFDAAISGWGGTIESDPYQLFHSSQVKGRGSNYVGFSNDEADEIIEQARRTLEPQKRYALYHRFHRILHEQQPYTFLYSRPTYLLLDKRFENVKIHELGINPLEWYVPREKQKYK